MANATGILKGLFGNAENESGIDIDITNLVNIDGYPAGKDGYLLVSQCDNLIIAYLNRSPGIIFPKKDVTVKPMICTAYIKDKQSQRYLSKFTDGTVETDKIIVVNKKFMSWTLPKAFKRTLLEAQSAKSNAVGKVAVLEQADVIEYCEALSGHWKSTVKMAMGIRNRDLEKQCVSIGTALKKELKKDPEAELGLNKVGRVKIK